MQSYRFSNLLGATYRGGSVHFTPDGNNLLSAVGNRINVVDLVQGRCSTLEPENREDIAVLALSSDSRLLLSVDKRGHAFLMNFVRGSILCRINFKEPVHTARWSPSNCFLAVGVGRKLQLWRAPSLRLGWQFVPHRTLGGHTDDIVDVAWAPNSLFLVTSSKDMTVRIWSVDPMDGFEHLALAEHRSHVRGAFFSADMQYVFSLSRDGALVSLRHDLREVQGSDFEEANTRPRYCQPGAWSIASKASCNQPKFQKVTRCAFDAVSKLLAAGFSEGMFMLFELPEMQALQTLSLGTDALDAIALGANGDWLAVGSAAVGQLLVWEWRSETYVLKQQGHHWGVQCVAFSPSGTPSMRREKTLSTAEAQTEDRGGALAGRLLATGGYDGKVKLFNAQSGLCFVTFAEHTAAVSGLCFTPQGNAVLSASHDGSVRAFDLLRYRNFRTFAAPDGICRFASVAVDGGGEIVAVSAVGGKYAIYIWSIQTGNLLEVLAGHESNVESLKFSPSAAHPGQLVSASWDKTLRVWDIYAGTKGGAPETLVCPSNVVCVTFDPRGNDECAASCLSGQVLFWNVDTGVNRGSIDGLRDIRSGRQWHDKFVATNVKGGKKASKTNAVNQNQHFSALSYTRSGEMLAGCARNSPHVCLYDTNSCSLAMRLTLTTNRSISGVQVMLNSKDMTETGTAWQEFDLSDDDVDALAGDQEVERKQRRKRQAESLPGVHVGEAKDMYNEQELHVWDVAFSADSQQLAAASTHGVFVFSADLGLGVPGSAGAGDDARFVPQMLTKNVSAPAVIRALEAGNDTRAMILALALNDYGLLRRAYESVPAKSIPVVCASIGAPLLPALLWFLSLELRPATGTPHFQFHVLWVTAVIDLHFLTLLEMSQGKATARTGTALEAAASARSDVASLCLQLLAELSQRHAGMVKTFDSNRYLLKFLGTAPNEGEVVKEETPETQRKSPAAKGSEIGFGQDAKKASPQVDDAAMGGRKKKRRRAGEAFGREGAAG